jgi:guanylate kinase
MEARTVPTLNTLGVSEENFKIVFPQIEVIIIAGPTAAGKGKVIEALLQNHSDLVDITVSVTTREQRANEKDGSYFHVSPEYFQELEDEGHFFETAVVHGNRYGTLKSEMMRVYSKGKVASLEIDMEGVRQTQEKYGGKPAGVLILPPSHAEQMRRLLSRGPAKDRDTVLRLGISYDEVLQGLSLGLHPVINYTDKHEATANQVADYLRAHLRASFAQQQ